MRSERAFATALALTAAVLLVACGGDGGGDAPAAPSAEPPAAPAAPAATGNAVIAGTISYANGDPDVAIDMSGDPICLSLHSGGAAHTEKIVADGGGLANVFVYVKRGIEGSYPAPEEKALLSQRHCRFEPHVSGIMVGQTLVIRNLDPTLHKVHAMPRKNAEFVRSLPFPDSEFETSFEVAEVMVPFQCDMHPWMASYMGVLKHPFFAVSGADGSFSIGGVPAGDYEIEAWHEELGAKTMSVSVAADGAAEANFDFSPAA